MNVKLTVEQSRRWWKMIEEMQSNKSSSDLDILPIAIDFYNEFRAGGEPEILNDINKIND